MKSDKPVQLSLDREVWERQPKESTPAWQAFIHYRDMETRSQRKVAATLDKAPSIISHWGRRWKWQERVIAWDNHLNSVYQTEREKGQKEMAENHVKLSKGIQAKVAQRLRTLRPEDISPGDLSRLLDVAVKIERLALGAHTEHTKAEVDGKVTVKHEFGVATKIFEDTEARQLYLALMAKLYMVEPNPDGPRDTPELGEIDVI